MGTCCFRQRNGDWYTSATTVAFFRYLKRPVRFWLLLAFLPFGGFRVLAQDNVSVNYSTGTAHISIPISTVQRGALAVPVSLEYNATGVRVNDVDGRLGMGWQLNAGGAISRELRDLPDDVKNDKLGNSRMGWLFNSNGSAINGFAIANDNNPTTCTDETADINYLNSNFSNLSDLEPDIFDVSAPGLNGRLIFDNTAGVFRPIPFADWKINYSLNSSGNGIASFTITNDQGVTYTFAIGEGASQTATSVGSTASFGRNFALYQNGVDFCDRWYLSNMTDANGNSILFRYVASLTEATINPVATIVGSGSSTWSKNVEYNLQQTVSRKLLACIRGYYVDWAGDTYYTDSVNFTYSQSYNMYYQILKDISTSTGRTFSCVYAQIGTNTKRDYLRTFGEVYCGTTAQYSFTYAGVNYSNFTGTLPDSASNAQDYWGYYNGNSTATSLTPQVYVFPDNAAFPNLERYRLNLVPGYSGTYFTLSGEDRSVSANYVATSALNQMTTPMGGTVTFTYEPNDYFDNSAASTYFGGGIRIKQILFYDGIDMTRNVTRNYIYSDPSTGRTTGRPISLPQFSYTLPYFGNPGTLTFWNTVTYRSELNLSTEDISILYNKITEQQVGRGKTLYEYNNPGMFWDMTSAPDWTPTIVNVAAPVSGGACPIYSAKNSTYNYPFIPNVNYEFERAIPSKITQYNDAGIKVGQTVYSYQRSFTSPIKIPALKFDVVGGATYYNKYFLYCVTSELPSSTARYVNDVPNTTDDATKRQQTTTNFYYQSAGHKSPTLIESINTDGSTNRSYIKYAKDYAASTATDPASLGIQNLVNSNQNLPIEQYVTVTRGGGERTFGAELVKYGLFSFSHYPSLYLPAQRLKFTSSAGATDFSFSSISGSGTFSNYAGYSPVVNYSGYTYSGALLSSDDNYHNTQTNLIDPSYFITLASVKNANVSEVAYTSFENWSQSIGSDYGFAMSNLGVANGISRSGSKSGSMTSSTLMSKTMTLKANAGKYVFSCWTNAAASGSLTVTLYNGSGGLFNTTILPYATTGSGSWKYNEIKVLTAGLTATFTINVQSSGNVNLDDILFYPDNSEISIFAYSPSSLLKTSETNTNGVSKYYTYDAIHRLQYVFDQDKNMILKKTYVNVNATSNAVSAGFGYTPGSGLYPGENLTFTGNFAYNTTCLPGLFYTWNFGDGATVGPTLNQYSQTHAYSSAGSYNVTLTITDYIFGTTSSSQTVVVGPGMGVTICQSGVSNFDVTRGTVITSSCPPNPSDNTHSYFTVTSISNAPTSPDFRYQWQVNYTDGGTGSGVWSDWGYQSTSNQLSVPFSMSSARPFGMRVVVTDLNSGQTATSNVLYLNPPA